MRYVIITGEVSGDKIGAAISKALQAQDAKAQIYAMGGQVLHQTDVEIVQDHTDLAVMGFSSLPKKGLLIRRAYKNVRQAIDKIKPNVIIYVDFAGFNMNLGRWAKRKGYKNIYIAPPKTWASRSWRNRAIKRDFDLLLTLFPFTQEYFASLDFPAQFLGHPLLATLKPVINRSRSNPILIAPGSRAQEISSTLPVLAKFITHSPESNFIVSKVPTIDHSLYHSYLGDINNVSVSEAPLSELLPQASMAIITSGTATLEAATMDIPQVVIYNTSYFNYHLAKKLILTDFISLPNLILNRPLVPELIQQDLTVQKLEAAINSVSTNESALIEGYSQIRNMYGQDNPAAQMAKAIIELI